MSKHKYTFSRVTVRNQKYAYFRYGAQRCSATVGPDRRSPGTSATHVQKRRQRKIAAGETLKKSRHKDDIVPLK